jgi:hypothetical protein
LNPQPITAILHDPLADICTASQVEELTRIGVYGEVSRFADHQAEALELEEKGDLAFWEGMQVNPRPPTLNPV